MATGIEGADFPWRMIDQGRGMREESRGLRAWIPTRVSVRRDFMIAKDPHAHRAKTFPRKQFLRDLGDTAEVIEC
jgi:hypothetical protein